MIIDSFTSSNDGFVNGRLRYINEDMGLDYEPDDQELVKVNQELTLIIAKTLELIVTFPEKRLLYPFGYLPIQSLHRKPVGSPEITKGSVFLATSIDNDQLGMSYNTALSEEIGDYDTKSGWVCIGKSSSREAILIADDVAVSIEAGLLKAVWLHPIFEE